jgi:hypothetical protein
MTTRRCVQCGNPLPEKAKFCGQCGVVVDVARPAAPIGARTLLSSVPPPAGRPEPAAVAPASPPVGTRTLLVSAPSPTAPAPPAVSPATKRTIVGLPSLAAQPAPFADPRSDGTPVAPPPPLEGPAPGAEMAPPAAPSSSQARPHARKTVLGVAIPGIAPLRAGDLGPQTANASSPIVRKEASLRPGPPRGLGETIPIPAFFVPPPAPLLESPAPSGPLSVRRRGTPLWVAALILLGVSVVGGSAAIAILWPRALPIGVQPRVAADGKDVLHLTCDARSCPDGTLVSLEAAKAAFAGGEADLPLETPLHVGENTLSLAIDRRGMGRDETVKLVVPVAYRVRADLTTMEAASPSITIRVAAPKGTEVRIDDKPIALDATGAGSYVLDEAAAVDGPADESRPISIEVPYVVVPTGGPAEKGTVSAHIAIAPLRVDAPGPSTVIDEDKVLVAGRAAKGSSVAVDGAQVAVGADGAFESTIAVPAQGQRLIEVRAGTSVLASRRVHLAVTRVASLVEAAKAFEARAPIGYDAAMRAIAAAKTGAPIVVEGEVVEARGSGHRTLVLVDDRRGCAKGPCLARIIVGRDLALTHGEVLRAYGNLARAYRTPAAQTVPEVEAEFVLRATR